MNKCEYTCIDTSHFNAILGWESSRSKFKLPTCHFIWTRIDTSHFYAYWLTDICIYTCTCNVSRCNVSRCNVSRCNVSSAQVMIHVFTQIYVYVLHIYICTCIHTNIYTYIHNINVCMYVIQYRHVYSQLLQFCQISKHPWSQSFNDCE
jgi:hypothetical protein